MDMSNSGLRSELGNEARQEIVRAAAEVFMEFGFAGSTIDAVANRLGATKGRIYHYFSSKAALFFEVQRSAMERLTREVEPLARGPGSPADRLRAMAFRHTMVILEDLPIQKVSVQGLERQLLEAAVGRHTRKFRNATRLRDEYEQLFAEVIDEGVRAGLFVDLPPRLATKPFFGVLNWLIVWYSPRRLQTKDDRAELAHMLSDFAMRGISTGSQT
ncbi:MAG: TetR/AcrR family transcriptional regulator [Steroidobacteraceae bacterium]|jgi:AcrR family transcriptional regulator